MPSTIVKSRNLRNNNGSFMTIVKNNEKRRQLLETIVKSTMLQEKTMLTE